MEVTTGLQENGAAARHQSSREAVSQGLSNSEVAQRIKAGQVNGAPMRSSRSLGDILFNNIVTPFNGLLMVLVAVVILVDGGAVSNALFGIVIIVNSGIGTFQELRAKRMLDNLAILSAPHARVIREGQEREVAVDEVVLGDTLHLQWGDQVVADGRVVASNELEIDESLLTGESDPIAKGIGEEALSGSIVVAGSGYLEVTAVGADAYSTKITEQAKRFQHTHSELVSGTNKLLKWISWMLVVVAPLLVWGQLRLDWEGWQKAVVHATAAIVGMIPEGLVLLTSMAFMLAAMVLAKRKVLVQQMPAVEGLARVDTLLLDKTGTLTEGTLRYEGLIACDQAETGRLEQVLKTMAGRSPSPTNSAIKHGLSSVEPLAFDSEVPFSSARKWSALTIGDENWIMGAPELLLGGATNPSKGSPMGALGGADCAAANSMANGAIARTPKDCALAADAAQAQARMLGHARELAAQGKRVMAIVSSSQRPDATAIPTNSLARALVVLSESIRPDAEETLGYFAQQGTAIKIVSGDNPLTVAAVARAVGIAVEAPFDARELPADDKACLEVIEGNQVFGRVQPEQKRRIARLLQKAGHVVAMTGDGVNDALALKDADIGIAMNSGASATKALAELVLMDNQFAQLPRVLAEGRRVIANIERVANLFIIKNVYSLALSLAVTVMGLSYPYLPIQMTVISALTIGIPAFFLALAPNHRIYQPGFLKRVLGRAVPIGLIGACAMLANYCLLASRGDVTPEAAGTATSIVVLLIGFTVIVGLARPLRGWKVALVAFLVVASVAMMTLPPLAAICRYSLDLSTLPVAFATSAVAMLLVCIVQHRMGKPR
ncbi:MAG: HAD-IC family P-type ATPase [Coriobacteriaceae bacterium]|jgi:cation-transporting ATPase E|nr:HAD-IC family P-type ATPase [Coriobacteriaceae bacterium]